MSILIEQDQDLVALQRGTRRFLMLGLGLVLATVVAILVRQGLFRQTASLGFVADSAQDIGKGQPVKIAGFRVGSVDTVTLRPDGKVEVVLEINADHMRFVTRDAVVELHKEGLVGSAVLEILPGPDKTRLAANEAMLAFTRAEGLTAMANSLRDKILPVLGDIKTITGTLADPQQGLPATLAQVRASTASLHVLLQTGTRQTQDVGQAATRVMGTAETDLSRLGQTLTTVNGQLPVLLDKVQRVVDHVEKISATAEVTVPPALQDGKATAADVRGMVEGAKSAWPIRNLLPPPAPQTLAADSDPAVEGIRVSP